MVLAKERLFAGGVGWSAMVSIVINGAIVLGGCAEKQRQNAINLPYQEPHLIRKNNGRLNLFCFAAAG
ncbi:hypothetical protein [Massilia sp. TWR1-2-2]|uniref:hypothetical protein n=1 Tax=Massilia sp. TWR1-2-2 TaxID=2804584 RepID=UPI003CECF58F